MFTETYYSIPAFLKIVGSLITCR